MAVLTGCMLGPEFVLLFGVPRYSYNILVLELQYSDLAVQYDRDNIPFLSYLPFCNVK